ncbi:hypothetical protein X737_33580 [Mesorhizobium sp. L48C026A00]|nr:hypothetical protein X737_33580 [Mesorhizobium sp. L48C026A00]
MAEPVAATMHRIDLRVSIFDLIDAGSGLGAAFSRGEQSMRLFPSSRSSRPMRFASDHEFADGFPADPVVKERTDLAGAQLTALLLQRRPVPSNVRESNIRAATAG